MTTAHNAAKRQRGVTRVENVGQEGTMKASVPAGEKSNVCGKKGSRYQEERGRGGETVHHLPLASLAAGCQHCFGRRSANI